MQNSMTTDDHLVDEDSAVKTPDTKLENGETGAVKSTGLDLLKYEKRDIRGDTMNFILLTFLYFIQGAVAGLMMAVPFILEKRKCSYQQQAIFHLSTYAVSFKILWVPILDSLFLGGEGRRKLVATSMQYLIGLFLLVVSINVDSYLGTDDGMLKPDIGVLTVIFFLCSLFSSVQDVALDGWSLSIFQKKSKVYSASSRSIGVSLGVMIIFPSFINLESSYFANLFRSVPGDYGFVDFADFTFFLSAVFIVTTTLILKFKKEKRDGDIVIDLSKADKDRHQDIKETYAHIGKILKLGHVQMMVFFLLTWHIAFGPVTNLAPLKLLDYGVPRGKLSILMVCGLPLQLFLPFMLNRYVKRPQPVRIFFIAYLLRLLSSITLAVLVFLISSQGKATTREGYWYYAPIVILFSFDYIAVYAMIMSVVALFTRISDLKFGSAFMTLLISLNKVGGSWPSTICLWFMDLATIRTCVEKKNPACYVIADGFYVEMGICTFIGIVWLCWAKKQIHHLEKVDAALVHNIA